MALLSNSPAPPGRPAPGPRGLRCAGAALLVGLLYAAVSAYWGLGGTALLSTVSGSLARNRPSGLELVLGAWMPAVLKVIAAALPMVLVYPLDNAGWQRIVRAAAWLGAVALTAYGLVLTVSGLLVQSGLVRVAASADHRALAWHAYLWDPWFLLWGLLLTGTLLRTRARPDKVANSTHAVATVVR